MRAGFTGFLFMLALTFVAAGFDQARGNTEEEVTATIVAAHNHINTHQTWMPETYSKDGALEFWSSGGLLHEVSDRGTDVYEWISVQPKHIRVITLIEDRAAVAHYYSEGSMKPKGYPAVSHYLTRVSEVFVKEDGKWKIRSAHWSPIAGGSGTTQSAQITAE